MTLTYAYGQIMTTEQAARFREMTVQSALNAAHNALNAAQRERFREDTRWIGRDCFPETHRMFLPKIALQRKFESPKYQSIMDALDTAFEDAYQRDHLRSLWCTLNVRCQQDAYFMVGRMLVAKLEENGVIDRVYWSILVDALAIRREQNHYDHKYKSMSDAEFQVWRDLHNWAVYASTRPDEEEKKEMLRFLAQLPA